MPSYKAVLRNGEKRCVVFGAYSISPPCEGVFPFRSDDDDRCVVAFVFADQALYIIKNRSAA